MAIKSLKALTEAGIALREARDMVREIAESARERKAPYEAAIAKLEAELLNGFKALEMNSFKLNTGETITRSVKQAAEVVNEQQAIEWAKSWNGVKLDLRLVQMRLKQDYIEKGVVMPEGFTLVEREEVRVTVPKPKGEEDGEKKE
jgi:hypothetical protein